MVWRPLNPFRRIVQLLPIDGTIAGGNNLGQQQYDYRGKKLVDEEAVVRFDVGMYKQLNHKGKLFAVAPMMDRNDNPRKSIG